MREIRTSGLMSGDGKRGMPTAPVLDSTDQGQEAAYSRRHAGPLDARHRACRRHPGSRWRRASDGHAVRHLSLPSEALCRWRISGRRLSRGAAHRSEPREPRDRQALRSSAALRRLAQTLDRRADLRLARTMPKARQGLGMPQSQSTRLPQARLHPSHAAKTMQSKVMFPDRWGDWGLGLRMAAPFGMLERGPF